MKPQTIGRVLGIGVRVAGRVAGQRLAGDATRATTGNSAGAPVTHPVTIDAANESPSIRMAGRSASRATGTLSRGVGGFLKPFRRVGNILFLEVVGVFFFVFVLVFAQTLWRTRASYLHGPDHQKFLVAAGLALVFLYLSLSSFWRARRK
jgi:hypothetical protein